MESSKYKKATFGAGCFWCVEAVFQNLDGVEEVVSGYSGGEIKNPGYMEVCSGRTGHAEVVEITYDPDKISFEELLEVFWRTHDPTTLNKQGADVGTQYRSVIYYHDEEQKHLAEKLKSLMDAKEIFDKPVVTETSPAKEFYKAEEHHQNYFNKNPEAAYCAYVIKPKLEKFKNLFGEKLIKRD
jgi:peptide-methionine (S)-S-oxide reductase